jgi:hypothetical protein
MSERATSLFALTIADVVIINMWTSDVGRYSASSYPVLRDIFEVNLKLELSNKDAQKKLLFIIRDFTGNNPEQVKLKLLVGVEKIWSEC